MTYFEILIHRRSRRCRWLRVIFIVFVAQLIVSLACLIHISRFLIQGNSQLPGITNRRNGVITMHHTNDQLEKLGQWEKPICPLVSPYLKGKVKIFYHAYPWDQIERRYYNVGRGGRFKPFFCLSRHRVAIIVPYRGRKNHLKIFINNIHEFLENQQLDYGIFVVELAELADFNRGLALNVGFMEAIKTYDYQCFIFHDVDLMPENDHNIYTCPSSPRHMSVAVDSLNYTLPYSNIFGGVTAMTKEQFQQVNGYSNKFFGWGGEDDDLYVRIKANNMTITRYGADVARYKMLKHETQSKNADRYYLLHSTKNTSLWKKDGLNSLKYTILKRETRKLFTYILFDIDELDPVYYTDHKKIMKEYIKKMQEKLRLQSATQNDTFLLEWSDNSSTSDTYDEVSLAYDKSLKGDNVENFDGQTENDIQTEDNEINDYLEPVDEDVQEQHELEISSSGVPRDDIIDIDLTMPRPESAGDGPSMKEDYHGDHENLHYVEYQDGDSVLQW